MHISTEISDINTRHCLALPTGSVRPRFASMGPDQPQVQAAGRGLTVGASGDVSNSMLGQTMKHIYIIFNGKYVYQL
jgi:hypothetical protein